MSVDECLTAYQTLSQKAPPTEPSAWNFRHLFESRRFNPQPYETALKDMIRKARARDPSIDSVAVCADVTSPYAKRCLLQETAAKCKV